MSAINTKYSVGDKVYIIDSRGIGNEYVRVVLEDIRGIQISGYDSVTYEFRIMKRNERDIYTDIDEAKKAAKKQAKARYEKNLEIIDEDRLSNSVIKEES